MKNKILKASSPLYLTLIFLAPILGLLAPKALLVLLIIGAVLSLLFFAARIFSVPSFNYKIIAVFMLFLGWCLVSSGINGFDSFAVKAIAKACGISFAGFIFLSFVQYLREEKTKEIIFGYFPILTIMAAGIFAIDNIFNYPVYRIMHGFDWAQPVGIAVNNRGAVMLAFFIWPAIGILLEKKNIFYVASVFMLIFVSLVFIGNSQSAMFGVTAGAISFMGTRYLPRFFPLTVMIVITVGILFSPIIAKTLFEYQPRFVTEHEEAAAAQRVQIWHVVSEKIMEKPLWGWGTEATRTTAKSVVDNVGIYSEKWEEVYHPHNIALQIWLETGVVGVLLSLLFLWLVFFSIRTKAVDFALFTSIMSVGIVGYGMWQSWWISLLFLSSVIVMITHNDKKIL